MINLSEYFSSKLSEYGDAVKYQATVRSEYDRNKTSYNVKLSIISEDEFFTTTVDFKSQFDAEDFADDFVELGVNNGS